MRKHLFLTGKKQVGKSTLLRRLMEEKRLECAGFETKPFFIDGERRGFTLHGLVDMPPFENDCIISARIAMKRSVPVPQTFESSGVEILRRSLLSPCPYILMDELGKMESGAEGFCREVLDTLNGGKRVLGVLQQCGSPLVAAICAREDVTVIEVTEENRDSLFEELARSF